MRIIESTNTRAVERLIPRQQAPDPSVARRAEAIVADVRAHGDRALRAYARRLDGLRRPLEVSPGELRALAASVPGEVQRALSVAARHIRRVARRQLPERWRLRVAPGITIEQRVTPIARVGCYVPAGRYPLPSSLLMTAIPAAVAGVGEVIVVCPRPDASVAAAAIEAGVDRLFRIGGAQAIAALAYGTESVPRVDKIVGPGSAYVAAAKRSVASDCAIDFQAGPTELVVIMAQEGNADWIAADLVAQAEHDPEARVLLVTPSRPLAEAVVARVADRSRVVIPAQPALRRGAVVVTRTLPEAIALVDRMAPEHVICDEVVWQGDRIRAGTIFVGRYSAPAAGDYATGSNHVLPTGGAARSRGGLSAADFVRVMSVQRLTARGLARIAPIVTTLARAEGLAGHASSIEARAPHGAGRRSRRSKPPRTSVQGQP